MKAERSHIVHQLMLSFSFVVICTSSAHTTRAAQVSTFCNTSATNPKRPPTSRLPLLPLGLLFGPRPPEHLQEIRRPPPHPAVDVRFARFDVVVEVVPEGLDVRDDFGAARGLEVAGEEDCADQSVRMDVWKGVKGDGVRGICTESNVSHFALAGLQIRLSLEFERGIIAKEHLRRVLNRSPPGVDELLQEDFAKDSIRFFSEDGGEDDRDPVVRGFDINRLFVPVMDRAHLASFAYTLRRRLRCVALRLLLQIRKLLEGLLERCGHGVSLQQTHALDQVLPLLWRFGQVLEIDLHAEVVAGLRLHDVRTVFAL